MDLRRSIRRGFILVITVNMFFYCFYTYKRGRVKSSFSAPCFYPKQFVNHDNQVGPAINVSDILLETLGIPRRCQGHDIQNKFLAIDELKDLRTTWKQEVVFVTGASSDHYTESIDLVGSVQKYFPGQKIIFFDLGLEAKEVDAIQKWCNVEMRRFEFEMYPPHARKLLTYAFKPLIIQQMLREFSVVFWMDSSVRITAECGDELFSTAVASHGLVQPIPIGTQLSIFALTHSTTLGYFALDSESLTL